MYDDSAENGCENENDENDYEDDFRTGDGVNREDESEGDGEDDEEEEEEEAEDDQEEEGGDTDANDELEEEEDGGPNSVNQTDDDGEDTKGDSLNDTDTFTDHFHSNMDDFSLSNIYTQDYGTVLDVDDTTVKYNIPSNKKK